MKETNILVLFALCITLNSCSFLSTPIPAKLKQDRENREFSRTIKKQQKVALDKDINANKAIVEQAKKAGKKREEIKAIEIDKSVHKDNLSKLRKRTEKFNKDLKREYLKLSERLIAKNNYSDGSYFRRKAYKTKTHLDILPEDPYKWKIKDDTELNNLRIARENLLENLTFNSLTVAPKAAAQGIVSFDCWVEQRKNTWIQYEDDCKAAFLDIQKYLQQINSETKGMSVAALKSKYKFVDLKEDYKNYRIKPKREYYEGAYRRDIPASRHLDMNVNTTNPKGVEVAAKPKTEEVDDESTFITQDKTSGQDLLYIAYFDGSGTNIGGRARSEIEKSLIEIKRANPDVIILNGHTDRSFDNQQSLKISKQRADRVRDYLTSKGVNRARIKTYGFGKTDNIVDNQEGEKAPANNRVEILFKGIPAGAKPVIKKKEDSK